jgi:phosphoglycolate phosphatase-like HAD superfamily hydrolase
MPVRIAVDIDSTLHQYWDQLAAVAKQRFGVDLPYEQQVTWEVTLLRPEQLRACVAETHRAPHVLGAEPYPGAIEAIRAWHEAGHFIQVTSHRTGEAHAATARWLERIGLPYDELYCSYDKIARCVEIGIDVLIDDSPENLLAAAEAGITPATILHPWNRDLCEEEDIVCAPDWPTLAQRLAPVLGAA